MRRITTTLATSSVALVAVAATVPFQRALAQEDGAPTLVTIQAFEVAPADMSAFEDAVGKIVEAAGQAELEPRFRWGVYQKDDTYYVVDWPESMADFDDQDEWYRQYQGTPGEATLNEAFEAMAELDAAHDMWVDEELAELAYEPPQPMEFGDQGGVWIATEWVRMGQEEAIAENTRRVTALLEEIGFEYPVIFHRTRVGQGGRLSVIVPYDTQANLYGSKSLEAALAASEAGPRWGQLMQERNALLRDMESGLYVYRADLSYMPEGSM